MKRKRSIKMAIRSVLSGLLLFSLAACVSNGKPAEGKYMPGTYVATAKGFGGPVTVRITVDAKRITEVKAEGPSETKGVGSRAIDELPVAILKAQTAKIDGVSGATYSSNALKLAADQALAQAMGKGETSAVMKDGQYEATARGFNLLTPVAVSVTIAQNKITAITIGKNGETNGMPQVVQGKLVPRIIEAQSLAVDALCGATATPTPCSARCGTAASRPGRAKARCIASPRLP